MVTCPHCHSNSVVKISTIESEPTKPDIPNWFVAFFQSLITTFIIILIINFLCPPLLFFFFGEPFLAGIIAIFVNSTNSAENKEKKKSYKAELKRWKNGYKCNSCEKVFIKSGFFDF